MLCFVTGAAGFIGSSLVDRLLRDGHDVIGYDNLSTGQLSFLNNAGLNSKFKFIEGDLLDVKKLRSSIGRADIVFHLAANADVRFGPDNRFRDVEQNIVATYNVLEAMLMHGIKKIVFSSTGSVYGEATIVPTPEDGPMPIQTSFYGNSKISAEGLLSAYAEAFGFQGIIFRFVSILGERYTHGHVFDFYKQLKQNPNQLRVLGNGKQRKSYLYIQDCIDAILIAVKKASGRINIFNLGQSEYCDVNFSVNIICRELGVQPELYYTGGDRGWVGDNPFIFLDCTRIRALGWEPKVSIKEAIIKTVKFMTENEWIFYKRE